MRWRQRGYVTLGAQPGTGMVSVPLLMPLILSNVAGFLIVGWPFGREELDPFYVRANEVVELGPYEYDPAYWEQQDASYTRIPLDEKIVRTKIWQFSPPTSFQYEIQRRNNRSSERVSLYTS